MNEVLIKRAFHSLTALYIHENEIGRQLMMARLRKKWIVWLEYPGKGGTPYNGLYGEAPPERGTLFKLEDSYFEKGCRKKKHKSTRAIPKSSLGRN